MGRIYLKRRSELELEQEIPVIEGHSLPDLKQNPQSGSRSRFRVPKSLISDWHNNLLEDKPHVNFTFELLHSWYNQFEFDYEPYYFRGQQTPIDWKSKMGNSDASYNIKTGHTVDLVKGDMVIREDSAVYLVNWEIQEHANNKASQVAKCNIDLTVTRHVKEETDRTGYLIAPAHTEIVVDALPSIMAEYAGRPDFTAAIGTPGVTPDHLITVSMQWNDSTKQIDIGDEFIDGRYTYRVTNITYDEVNRQKTSGVLKIYAKRVAGGKDSNGR